MINIPIKAQAPIRAIIPDHPSESVNNWEAKAPAISAMT